MKGKTISKTIAYTLDEAIDKLKNSEVHKDNYIIAIGTNHLADNQSVQSTVGKYNDLIHTIQLKDPHANIYACSVLPRYDHVSNDDITALNYAIQNMCNLVDKLSYIDTYTSFIKSSPGIYVQEHGSHPTKSGWIKLAMVIRHYVQPSNREFDDRRVNSTRPRPRPQRPQRPQPKHEFPNNANPQVMQDSMTATQSAIINGEQSQPKHQQDKSDKSQDTSQPSNYVNGDYTNQRPLVQQNGASEMQNVPNMNIPYINNWQQPTQHYYVQNPFLQNMQHLPMAANTQLPQLYPTQGAQVTPVQGVHNYPVQRVQGYLAQEPHIWKPNIQVTTN
ncbi:unnamed protein product [Owenia fusiformis]|uniref:Uncharacterized protein n=1 Tax=Owenia fusiformis TaxID=6347 RepID=A0A8J1UJM2_OWEFU|nr:unnamed protein product [Owenia fusiformis]